MYQSQTQRHQRDEQSPQYVYVPKNTQTEARLQKFLNFEYQISDLLQVFRVCQVSAEERILAFTSSSRALGLQPEYYQQQQQGTKRNYHDQTVAAREVTAEMSPRARFEERAAARLELPIRTAEIERLEMEQAQFIWELQAKCEKQFPSSHEYVVFHYRPPPPQEAPPPDSADLRCIRCFKASGDAASFRQQSSSNQIVHLYPSTVDFHGKMMNQGGGTQSMTTLQALF